jgi:hypothetical protein
MKTTTKQPRSSNRTAQEPAHPIPSQAEGDRETVEESLRQHEAKGDLRGNKKTPSRQKQ